MATAKSKKRNGHQYLEGALTLSSGGGFISASYGTPTYDDERNNATSRYVVIDGAISGSGPLTLFDTGYSGTSYAGIFFVNGSSSPSLSFPQGTLGVQVTPPTVPEVTSQEEVPAPEPLTAVNSGGVTIVNTDVFKP